ncbi:MAG: type I-C CRISPR-associated protein Cas5c [Pseudomonadota bacterium]
MRVVDIKVWGEYACFTRPEFKVERVSYPVMTPSAARGVLEAIYWKPQIRYRIQRIGILQLGTHWSLLRNEISSRQSDRSECLIADDPQQRQQRTSLVLKDVVYRVQAWIEPRNGEVNIAKHLDCFRRRADKGQYFHKPFLGCREFAADAEWLGDKPDNDKSIKPDCNLNLLLGTMLYDTAYISNNEHYESEKHKQDRLEFWRHENGEAYEAKGYAKRLFFNAEIKNGWLVEKDRTSLPDSIYEEMKKLEV